jgi:hypothetical protein
MISSGLAVEMESPGFGIILGEAFKNHSTGAEQTPLNDIAGRNHGLRITVFEMSRTLASSCGQSPV